MQYFEQDDPEFFLGKVKYLLDNDVLEMELTFSEEEYSTSGQLIKVHIFWIIRLLLRSFFPQENSYYFFLVI